MKLDSRMLRGTYTIHIVREHSEMTLRKQGVSTFCDTSLKGVNMIEEEGVEGRGGKGRGGVVRKKPNFIEII